MLEFIKRLFDTSDFPERWHCGLWSSAHGWTHIVSDWLIFGAYFTIPAILVYFVRRRRDVPFPRIFWAFGAFILFCGLGHLMESLIFWWPAYRMSALVKVCTAAASWVTVLALIPVLPRALRLPGLAQMNAKLEAEIGERTKAEASLREREAELLLALQASGMGTWRWDFPGDELRLSAETLALLRVRGEPPRRLEELMALVLEEDRAALKSALKLARTDPSVEGRFKTEFRLADPDRPMRWLEAHGRLVLDEMGRGVAFRGTMADATERKQLEMDLLQAKKLENVGHLAGGSRTISTTC
ncbi:MAG: PAS domain-containing protein [Planctomycetota bacterium]|nr:PAS domain-containing protein [Planctomycetota bacterium]